MNLIRISAVSFLNTYPFIYGLKNSSVIDKIDLSVDIPSICARKLLDGTVDIGLVPVTAMSALNFCDIISPYCIGAIQKVRTVMMFSKAQLIDLKKIYLDYQSNTSNQLIKVLSTFYWKIKVEFEMIEPDQSVELTENEARVVIGDRVFEFEKKYPFVFDLAEEWNRFTNLPFVFAAWVSNKTIDIDFKNEFNEALKDGINSIDRMLAENFQQVNSFPGVDTYYTQNISYQLDNLKEEGMKLFFKYIKYLNQI